MSERRGLSWIERALTPRGDQTGGRMRGAELIDELASASGLPIDLIGQELSRIVAASGLHTSDVTLDELREMLALYLQDVLLDAKKSLEE